MKNRILAVASVGALVVGAMTVPAASAATPAGLKVTTARKATAYHGKRVRITPEATATGQQVITSLRITAYRGKKKVASGRTIRLRPGKYKTRTTGTYRTYTLVTRTVDRPVVHEAAVAEATCRVTSSSTVPIVNITFTDATCTNPDFPTQTFVDTTTIPAAVGSTYPQSHPFAAETVIEPVAQTTRSYSATKKFSSAKRPLKVRDRGRRHR